MVFFWLINYFGGENVYKVFVDIDCFIVSFFVFRVIVRIIEEIGLVLKLGREFNDGSCGLWYCLVICWGGFYYMVYCGVDFLFIVCIKDCVICDFF